MKKNFRVDTVEDFETKYHKYNKAGKVLLNKFFQTIKKIIPKDVKNAIEIGCGAGFSTKRLKDMFPPSIIFSGSDLQADLIQEAKKQNPDIDFAVESIYSTPHHNDSFDLIFCLEVLEHLENPEIALKELKRITKKYVIVTVPNEPLWRVLNVLRGAYWKNLGNTPGHINHWSKRKMIKFMSKEFNIITATTSLPWIIILAEKKIRG